MITANPAAAVPIRKRDGFDRLMYDGSSSVMQGAAEVVAYGTAVKLL